jgi:hypothetical protein
VFELFAESIDGMPPQAVLNFLKRMHGTMEDALLYKQIDDTSEVDSILCFCQFINLIVEEDMVFPMDGLPVQHVALYRKVVSRLAAAEELPVTCRAKFDAAFSAAFFRNLANA